MSSLGRWAYIVGVVISLLSGFVSISGAAAILFLLGLVVGFLNIGEKEGHDFLVAVLALLVVGFAGAQVFADGGVISTMLANFVSFASAAALVVALKTVISSAKS